MLRVVIFLLYMFETVRAKNQTIEEEISRLTENMRREAKVLDERYAEVDRYEDLLQKELDKGYGDENKNVELYEKQYNESDAKARKIEEKIYAEKREVDRLKDAQESIERREEAQKRKKGFDSDEESVEDLRDTSERELDDPDLECNSDILRSTL